MADDRNPQVFDTSRAKKRPLEGCLIEVSNEAWNRDRNFPSRQWRITDFAYDAFSSADRAMQYGDISYVKFQDALKAELKYDPRDHVLNISSSLVDGDWIEIRDDGGTTTSRKAALIQALTRAATEGIGSWTFRFMFRDRPLGLWTIAEPTTDKEGPSRIETEENSEDENGDFIDYENAGYEDELTGAEDLMYTWADNIRDNKACEQWDDEFWEDEVCEWFEIDPKDTNPGSKTSVAGMKFQFFNYQLYAILWMMKTARGPAGGGFLGDEQGLGKTCVGLGYCIIEHLLAEAWLKIEESYADPTTNGQHLKPEQAQPGVQCPTNRPYRSAIPCPCSYESASYGVQPHQGPTLIVVPPGLLKVWQDEFKKMIQLEDGTTLNMELITLHTSGEYDKGDETEKERIRAILEGSRQADRTTKKGLTKYIFLTSAQSMIKQMEKTGFKDECWGRIIRDEFHLMKTKRANGIKALKALRGWPQLWALSGTPFETSPADLDGYLDILRETNDNLWKKEPYSLARTTEYNRIKREYNKIMNKLENEEAVPTADIQAVSLRIQQVLEAFMVRRTTDTKWFGQPIVNLPPNTHEVLKVKIEDRYKGDFRSLRTKLQRKQNDLLKKRQRLAAKKAQLPPPKNDPSKFYKSSRILRMAETVPHLGRIKARKLKPGWLMTSQEIIQNDWYNPATQNNPYRDPKFLNPFATSAKIKMLISGVIDKLGLDYVGRREKLIVFSNFPVVAFIIYLVLKRQNYRVLLIHAKIKATDRSELLRGFQGALCEQDEEEDKDGTVKIAPEKRSKLYKEGDAAEIVVSTPELIGTGYTLTRAFRSVMMEPAWLAATEKQAHSRIRRIGQKNPMTYTYRLETDDKHSVENRVITKQKNRGDIANMCFGDEKDPEAFDMAELAKEDAVEGDPDFDASEDEDAAMQTLRYAKGQAKTKKKSPVLSRAAAAQDNKGKNVPKGKKGAPAKKAKAPAKAKGTTATKRKRKQESDDEDNDTPAARNKRAKSTKTTEYNQDYFGEDEEV